MIYDKDRKAYKIVSKWHEPGGYEIVSETTSGAAKTHHVNRLREVWGKKASYALVKSCRRAPEYDELARKYRGAIKWHDEGENWEQDRGSWKDGEVMPKTYEERLQETR